MFISSVCSSYYIYCKKLTHDFDPGTLQTTGIVVFALRNNAGSEGENNWFTVGTGGDWRSRNTMKPDENFS